MEDYQQRIIIEQEELKSKLRNLTDFMSAPNFVQLDPVNQGLLMAQEVAMRNYANVLDRRIELF